MAYQDDKQDLGVGTLKARYGSLPQLSLMIQEMGEEELKIGTVWTDTFAPASLLIP